MDDYDLEDQLYQEFSDENGSIDSDLEEQAKSYLYHSVSAVAKPLENKFKSFSETKQNINGDSKTNSSIQNGESTKVASNLSKKTDIEGQDAESEASSNSDSDAASVEYETDVEDEEDPPTLELTNEAPETLAMDTELDAMLMDSNIENDRYFGNDKKCRNCGEVGHIAKNCSTRYCFICQSTEHIVSDCSMFHVHGREMFNHIPRGMRSDILSRCSVCDSESHSLRSCTKLWKEYTYNPLSKVNSNPGPVYCYKCSEKGHEGARCSSSSNDNERNRGNRGQYDNPRNSYRNNSSRDNRYDDRYDNRRDFNRSQHNDRHYSNNNYRGNNFDNRYNNGYNDRSINIRSRSNQYDSHYNSYKDNQNNNYRQNRNNNYHNGNYDNSNRNYQRNNGNRNYRY